MSDLSIYQIKAVAQTVEGMPETISRYVRAENFAHAIEKALDNIQFPQDFFLTDVHAEWMPDLEDIIE